MKKKKFVRINLSKFIRSIIIIILVAVGITFIATKSIYSYIEPEERVIYVQPGDTLWSLAKYAKDSSSYYKEMNIKDVVYELKNNNNLSSNNIESGQKIKIFYSE